MAGALGGLYLLYVCRVLVYSRDLFFFSGRQGMLFSACRLPRDLCVDDLSADVTLLLNYSVFTRPAKRHS